MGVVAAEVERARGLLREASSVAVMTGAGISAESGVPTFRGAGGMWRNRDPMSLATPEAFAADPVLVWEWYDWRRGLIAGCAPNAGHLALVALEARLPDFTLATQNVDGLHRLAGSRNVLELHGSIMVLRCTRCGAEREERTHGWAGPPACPACGGMERPGVVRFGEALPDGVIEATLQAVQRCEVFLVVGTSGQVYPAAQFAEIARDLGRAVVLVNLEPTGQSALADVALHGPAGELLPALVAEADD